MIAGGDKVMNCDDDDVVVGGFLPPCRLLATTRPITQLKTSSVVGCTAFVFFAVERFTIIRCCQQPHGRSMAA